MRKILYIIICTICLSVPARANVTNQLDEITAQIQNLDKVIQWFVDNESYLDYLVDGSFYTDYLSPILDSNILVGQKLEQIYATLGSGIIPGVTNIQEHVASLQEDVATLTYTVGYFYYDFVEMVDTLTSSVLSFRDDFLYIVAYELPNILDDNNLLLFQQFSDHFVLELGYLNEIRDAILSLENVWTSDDIIVTIKDLDDIMVNFVSKPLEAALVDLQNHVADASATLYSFLMEFQLFLSDFNYFLSNFSTLQHSQYEMWDFETKFINWYQGLFFEGLQTWGTRHSEWMKRHEEILQAQAEYGTNQMQFLAGEYSFPTDSDVSYLVELEKAIIEEEPEVPDEKIYAASDAVETDMEDVEHEITGAMDLVDSAFTGFLGDVQFNWGSFNPVMSFSYTLPFHDYTMELSYDFSESDLRAPCRTASTGIWSMVVFVQSFLAISGALRGVTEN